MSVAFDIKGNSKNNLKTNITANAVGAIFCWFVLFKAIFGFSSAFAADQVILISVDGLRPEAISMLGKEQLPGFYRFREQGAWTDNARTDFDFTRTLPNHSSIMTARPVIGDGGHGQVLNNMPSPATTLHNKTGKYGYITSIFDVVHDNGLSTALYVSKDRFVLFEQSYNAASGAKDITGEDNGTNKIDRYVYLSPDRTSNALVSKYLSDMSEEQFDFSFLHIVDPDTAGHGGRWTTEGYLNSVKQVDQYLTRIFDLIDSNSSSFDKRSIILVADHGGAGRDHGDPEDIENYRIPFYVWTSDSASTESSGKELYQLNKVSRSDPEQSRPDYAAKKQPIRNGDAANLALQLLGLPAIPDPGAIINARQDLMVQ